MAGERGKGIFHFPAFLFLTALCIVALFFRSKGPKCLIPRNELLIAVCGILIPRESDPFGQHQKSRCLAGPKFLGAGVEGSCCILNISDLPDLKICARVADFRCWSLSHISILGAAQKDCGL